MSFKDTLTCPICMNAITVDQISKSHQRGFCCKSCATAIGKKWKDDNRDRHLEIVKAGHLKKKYGITLKDFHSIMKVQGDVCAICRRSLDGGKASHIDHNHITNEIRGILCSKCNTAIGLLDEDENIIWNLLEYLKKTTWNKAS